MNQGLFSGFTPTQQGYALLENQIIQNDSNSIISFNNLNHKQIGYAFRLQFIVLCGNTNITNMQVYINNDSTASNYDRYYIEHSSSASSVGVQANNLPYICGAYANYEAFGTIDFIILNNMVHIITEENTRYNSSSISFSKQYHRLMYRPSSFIGIQTINFSPTQIIKKGSMFTLFKYDQLER